MQTPVEKALAAWQAAPLHVKALAGDYVKPLLWALADLEKRVFTLEKKNDGPR